MDSLARDKINNLLLFKLKSIRVISFISIIVTLIITICYAILNEESTSSRPWLQVSGNHCDYNHSIITGNDLWDGFSFGDPDIKPSELWRHNCNKSYQKYFDMTFVKDCGIPYKHEELFHLLKFWINLTAFYNIPWWLCYGSLIGALRHRDMVPWDSDIDISMPVQFESLVRNLSTRRKEINNKKVNIITRPGPHCPYNGPRMDCKGNMVTSQVDGCAFCGPLARIFFNPSIRIDVYLFDINFNNGKWELADEGIFEYTLKMPHSPLDWYLPLRNCSFMGFNLQCPRQSEVVLKSYYKTYHSNHKCENGKWNLI